MTAKPHVDSLLADFTVVISTPVQWGDQDAMGHVNNTIYLRWFESSRIMYLRRAGMMDLHEAENVGPILASVTCDYRRPVTYPDTVHVGARVVRIGRSSITMEHAIASRELGAIVAEGKATLVVFDYHKEKPHPVGAQLRQAIATLEGRSFD